MATQRAATEELHRLFGGSLIDPATPFEGRRFQEGRDILYGISNDREKYLRAYFRQDRTLRLLTIDQYNDDLGLTGLYTSFGRHDLGEARRKMGEKVSHWKGGLFSNPIRPGSGSHLTGVEMGFLESYFLWVTENYSNPKAARLRREYRGIDGGFSAIGEYCKKHGMEDDISDHATASFNIFSKGGLGYFGQGPGTVHFILDTLVTGVPPHGKGSEKYRKSFFEYYRTQPREFFEKRDFVTDREIYKAYRLVKDGRVADGPGGICFYFRGWQVEPPWQWERLRPIFRTYSRYRTYKKLSRPVHIVQLADATDGPIRRVAVVDLSGAREPGEYLQKRTSAVEGYVHVNLLGSRLMAAGFLPEPIIIKMDGLTYDFLDAANHGKIRREFTMALRDRQWGQIPCEMILKDPQAAMQAEWRSRDIEKIKITMGSHLYHEDEARLYGHDRYRNIRGLKKMVVKAKKGGAVGFLISRGTGRERERNLINSKQYVETFFSHPAVDTTTLDTVVRELSNLMALLDAYGVYFVGAGLIFLRDRSGRIRISLTDLNHAVFKRHADPRHPRLFGQVSKSCKSGITALQGTILNLKYA